MPKNARASTPKTVRSPAPVPAPAPALQPERANGTKATARPRRKARIDVDQAHDAKPTPRVIPASKQAKPATASPRREAKRSAAPRSNHESSGRVSALEAAAQVLVGLSKAEASSGITAPDLIERMAKARLWTSPGGKTPAATLYAAMIREIRRKGTASRFTRVSPGRFTASQHKEQPAIVPAQPSAPKSTTAARGKRGDA